MCIGRRYGSVLEPVMRVIIFLTGYIAAITLFVIGLIFALEYDRLEEEAASYIQEEEGSLTDGLFPVFELTRATNLLPEGTGYVTMGLSWFCAGATTLFLREGGKCVQF